MNDLPPEMIDHIFRRLSSAELLNCAMVSRKFLACAARIKPELAALRIALSDYPMCAGVDGRSNDVAWLQLCHSEEHGVESILQQLIPFIVRGAQSLEVEDELIKSRVSDKHISMLLAQCRDAPLKRLALSKCDLLNVQPWTLALLARFDQLEKLELDGCIFSVSESSLIRSLSTSFTTLIDIDMRDNKQITDKFSRSISRSCPLLETFRVSGCKLISTISVLALIESTFFRVKPTLTVYVDETLFSADQLNKFMHSPLFASSAEWRLSPTLVRIGYSKPALLAEHQRQRCVLIHI